MKMSELFHNCAYDVEYETAGEDVNYAFVEEPMNHTLYIYFQGSSSKVDWWRNFLFKKKPYKDMKIPYRVHRGFLAAWKEVEDIIIGKIMEPNTPLLDMKWKHIVVVGYSHGASLAFFATEAIWFHRYDLREHGLESYAFESPRVYGGWHVKKELKERWRTFKVIRNNSDLVTHLPPVLFRYCHVGEVVKIHGDVSLGPKEWYIPDCIKSHYPEVVYDGLVKAENKE